MRAIAFLRRRPLEVAWAAFAVASVAAMVLWPTWETIPFHFVWISLTLLYGFRVWGLAGTAVVLGAVVLVTGAAIFTDAFEGIQLWGELFEVPLMSAMFLAMVWHARRRQEALRVAKHEAAQRAALLDRQERFLHDASHELRTPVTIARGHLEIAARDGHSSVPEISIALDELGRIEGIVERLLLLAKAGQPDFIVAVDVDAEGFLEDVFMRWSEVAPRSWRLGGLATGTLRADPDALRNALDALLENAVRYTDVGGAVELGSRARGGELTIEVADDGPGISPEVLDRIFDRFARGDAARTRAEGGVGLGLAIVDAIARAHGGSCTASTSSAGSVFRLTLPGFAAEQQRVRSEAGAAAGTGYVPALGPPH
jgi:signal transduction histidine kinase